jgi:hypothetical protein
MSQDKGHGIYIRVTGSNVSVLIPPLCPQTMHNEVPPDVPID